MDPAQNRDESDEKFLWINKDETSVLNKDHLNPSLRAHVLREHALQKRVARQRHFQLAQLRRIQPHSLLEDEGAQRLSTVRKPPKLPIRNKIKGKPAALTAVARPRADQTARGSSAIEQEKTSRAIIPANRCSLSLTTYLNGVTDDPFSSMGTPFDDCARAFANRVWRDIASNVYLIARRTGHIGTKVDHPMYRELHRILIDPTELYSQLAIIPPYMLSTRRSAEFLSQNAGLMYQQKAIKQVQQNMKASLLDIPESTVYVVSRQAYIESIKGNRDGYHLHLNAAFQLVKMRGGLQTLKLVAGIEQLMMADIKCATMSGSFKLYFSLPWPVEDLPGPAKEHFPYHFTCPLNAPSKTSETWYASEFCAISTSNLTDRDWFTYERWIQRQTLSVEHRLLSLPYLATHTAIDEAIRLTTLLYTNTTLITLIPIISLQALLPRLQTLITHSPLDVRWCPFTDILFWILCVGLHLASASEHEEWFLRRVDEVARLLHFQEWSEAEGLLVEFFYLKWYHGPPLRVMWEEVVRRGLNVES